MKNSYTIHEMPPDELGEPEMMELTSGASSSDGREAFSVGSSPPGSASPGEYHVGSAPPGEPPASSGPPVALSVGQGQREPRFKGTKY